MNNFDLSGDIAGAKASVVASAAMGSIAVHAVPIFGVGMNVFIAAILGALAALLYSDPIRPVTKAFGLSLANAVVGVFAVGIAARVFPIAPEIQGASAFFLALFARWYIPAIIEVIPGGIRGALGRFVPSANKGG